MASEWYLIVTPLSLVHHCYLLMSTTDAYNTEFTAKCTELTKGSWPAWWYHTMLRLQKEDVLGLVKGS